ncbi:unnamed protein product [Rotaria magnacalcarata]|uniref:DUF4371 domain-containing protein n=7 Tax=Rotaria TaxID=231623 RepID=A0A819KDS5_9BILA|nr:unnamed protein product [Rotaria magnacalcarata]
MQLILRNVNFEEYFPVLKSHIDDILTVGKIFHLEVSKVCSNRFIEIINLLPKLDSLKISSLSLKQSSCLSTDETELFTLISNKNQITKVNYCVFVDQLQMGVGVGVRACVGGWQWMGACSWLDIDLSLMNKNQLKLNDIWKKQGANENKLSSSISVSSSHVELNNAAGEISIVNKKLCDSSFSDEINVINQNLSINDSGNEIEEICSIPSISSRIQAEDFADEISIVDQNPCVTRLLNVVSGSSLNLCMCMSASEIEVSYSIPSISTRVQAEDFVGKINVVDQNVSIKGDINVVNQNESNSSISCDVNLINESLFNSSISVSADEIQLSSVPSTSKSLSHLHGGDLAGEVNVVHKNDNNKTHKNKDSTPTRSKHRTQYLSEWEKRPESHYRTHIFDELGQLHERSICWLYMKEKSMRCRLCEKYGKARNTNGKENVWFTTGMTTFSFDKIKHHKEKSEVHKQSEQMELNTSSHVQPNWMATQQQQLNKHEQSIQNLMIACIYLCQQDNSINMLEPLCVLLEKLGIELLPAETSCVSYRSNKAAFCFIQHIASCLHEELVEKIKASPVVAWMLDESTSRCTEKTCIIYGRYIENNEAKTSYYGLLDLQGDGTAKSIVNTLLSLWRKDNINGKNSCWLSTDNASTFIGVNEGVIAKLRNHLGTDCLESNTCAAHSFALVGSQASYKPKSQSNEQPVLADSVVKLEKIISKIYTYFNKSANRQFKFKSWQNFMEIAELKVKRIFEIRWSSIRDCIKPIIANIQPGSQALIGYLEEAMRDFKISVGEREHSKQLLNLILDDEFLLLIHMHYDLHESVLGPITKMMQNDHLSYFNLMEMLKEKKAILCGWTFESASDTGPVLCDYLESSKNGLFGAFKITLGDRKKILYNCREHINRLLQELARRFPRSVLQESFSVLFDPDYLVQHKEQISSNEYGRSALNVLRKKYKNFTDFDFNSVRNEWESFKASLYDYVNSLSTDYPVKDFWKSFILQKQSINNVFCHVLMTVRMLLQDDLRSVRCQQIANKAFESWNDPMHNRRLNQIQILIDLPDDYEPAKQVRSVVKRNLSLFCLEMSHKKTKTTKAKAIKCANGCKTEVSGTDSTQNNAIQCCHQSEQFEWIQHNDNCSRWLCNGCRITLSIDINSLWFCCDHEDMRDDIDDDEAEENELS